MTDIITAASLAGVEAATTALLVVGVTIAIGFVAARLMKKGLNGAK